MKQGRGLPPPVGAVLARAAECFRSGRLAEAEALYRKILQAQPAQFDALLMLGVVKARRGDRTEAIRLIRKAIARAPAQPFAHLSLGDVLHDGGQAAEALASYDAALALAPDNPDVLNNRGNVLRDLGRGPEALAGYDRALAVAPGFIDAHNNRGALLSELGRPADALASHDRALAIAPAHPLAWFGRGVALLSLERHEEAITAFTRALAANAAFPQALNNRGNALAALGRYQSAIADYDSALRIRPDYAEAWHNRGNSRRGLGDPEAALADYDRALQIRADYAEAFNSRATALLDLNRAAEAIAACDRALAIAPGLADAHNNRGIALQALGRHQEALASYLRAQLLQPDDARAHVNEALCRLLTGDFAAGWAKYGWRWRLRENAQFERVFDRPLWLGEQDVRGKTVLLYAEQGFGDTIQFCRYATLLAERGARVVLEVQPPLKTLLAGLAGVHQVVASGEALPDYDFRCPLLSVPLAFATTLETIPARVPYLTPSAALVERWRERMVAGAPRIGLVWSGNPGRRNDRHRSVALGRLAPLFGVRAGFVSLQTNLRDGDRQWLDAHPEIQHLGDELADFADTAAVVSQLDLVISVDTAVAHLAGALGRPVWVLLSSDWRYLLDRDDRPWYPSARLFRQTTLGDWDSVIEPAARELRARFGAG